MSRSLGRPGAERLEPPRGLPAPRCRSHLASKRVNNITGEERGDNTAHARTTPRPTRGGVHAHNSASSRPRRAEATPLVSCKIDNQNILLCFIPHPHTHLHKKLIPAQIWQKINTAMYGTTHVFTDILKTKCGTFSCPTGQTWPFSAARPHNGSEVQPHGGRRDMTLQARENHSTVMFMDDFMTYLLVSSLNTLTQQPVTCKNLFLFISRN